MMTKNVLLKNDVVLIHIEKQPAFFARVETITPDSKRGWWQVSLLILQLPLVTVTWTIDDDQLCGASFTMGGTEVQIARVDSHQESSDEMSSSDPRQKGSARILSMTKNA